MVGKRTPKSEKLPKIGNPLRSFLLSHLTGFPEYTHSISKGIPLFTQEELKDLEANYKTGLTWDDIDRELSQKGILLKKATFRKYIQTGYLPKPMGYRKVGKGRVALYPADTISHINLLHYFYKVASGVIADNLLTSIKDFQISYLDLVEAMLGGDFSNNLYVAIYDYICFDLGGAETAISTALSADPENMKKAMDMLDDIDKTFHKVVERKIDKLVSFLKTHYALPEDSSSADEETLE